VPPFYFPEAYEKPQSTVRGNCATGGKFQT
jgi:hypothetical protein